MGTGKIGLLPFAWYGVNFPSTYRYLTTADHAHFDFGTDDFALEWVGSWAAAIANPSSEKVLVMKCDAASLNNKAGFKIAFQPSTKSVIVYLNDGSATPITNTWADVMNADTVTFLRFEFDRNVGLTLYKNGVQFGSVWTDLTTRAGSVSNNEVLIAGGVEGTATSYFEGNCSLLAVDGGHSPVYTADNTFYAYSYPVNYGQVWNLERYYKWLHGWPRTIGHYRAMWNFQNSLEDDGPGNHDFVMKDNAGAVQTASYSNTYPYGIFYNFSFDPLPGSLEEGPLYLDTPQRSLDGSLRLYRGPDKRYRRFTIRTTDMEQWIAIMGAYYSRSIVHLWDQQGSQSYQPINFMGYFSAPPKLVEMSRHGNPASSSSFKRLWEITCELEER